MDNHSHKTHVHDSQRKRKAPQCSVCLARVAAVATTICLVLLSTSSAHSQCDWAKKIAVAIQRRYQTNENACKALLAPSDEFNQAHALIENEYLSQYQFVTDS